MTSGWQAEVTSMCSGRDEGISSLATPTDAEAIVSSELEHPGCTFELAVAALVGRKNNEASQGRKTSPVALSCVETSPGVSHPRSRGPNVRRLRL